MSTYLCNGLLNTVMHSVSEYRFSYIGFPCQTVLSMKRYHGGLVGPDQTFPWRTLDEQTWNITVPLTTLFSVATACLLMAGACNLFMFFTQCCKRVRYRTEEGQKETVAKSEEDMLVYFRPIYYKILVGLAAAMVFVGCFDVIFLPLAYNPNGYAVASHTLRNVSMMSILNAGLAAIMLGFMFAIDAFTLADVGRNDDAIVSPKVVVHVRQVVAFVWFTVPMFYVYYMGGTPGSLTATAMVIFAVTVMLPTHHLIVTPSSNNLDLQTMLEHWNRRFLENALTYLSMALASLFMALPVSTYNPAFFNLGEDKEVYWWIPAFIGIVAVAIDIYLVVMMFMWSCRDPKERNLPRLYLGEKYAQFATTFAEMTPEGKASATNLYEMAYASGRRGSSKSRGRSSSKSHDKGSRDNDKGSKDHGRSKSRDKERGHDKEHGQGKERSHIRDKDSPGKKSTHEKGASSKTSSRSSTPSKTKSPSREARHRTGHSSSRDADGHESRSSTPTKKRNKDRA